MEFIHTFRVDKLSVRVAFRLNNEFNPKVECIVSDQRVQFCIEKSTLFKSGFITLAEEYGKGQKIKKSKAPTVFETFEREDVIEELKKAGKKKLTSFEDIKKATEDLNYSFPNVDFEEWKTAFEG